MKKLIFTSMIVLGYAIVASAQTTVPKQKNVTTVKEAGKKTETKARETAKETKTEAKVAIGEGDAESREIAISKRIPAKRPSAKNNTAAKKAESSEKKPR